MKVNAPTFKIPSGRSIARQQLQLKKTAKGRPRDNYYKGYSTKQHLPSCRTILIIILSYGSITVLKSEKNPP